MRKIGYSALGWNEEFTRTAQTLKDIGYNGIELFGIDELMPLDCDFGRTVGELGIDVIATYFASAFRRGLTNREKDKFNRVSEILSTLGSNLIVLGGGRKPKVSPSEGEWQKFVDCLGDLRELAVANGVEITYHPHSGTMVFTQSEIERLVTELPWLPLTLDTAHLHLAGIDFADMYKNLVGRCNHVHLKDVNYNGRFVELGEGSLDLGWHVTLLKQFKYEGWLTIELDATPHPRKSAETSFSYLRRLL